MTMDFEDIPQFASVRLELGVESQPLSTTVSVGFSKLSTIYRVLDFREYPCHQRLRACICGPTSRARKEMIRGWPQAITRVSIAKNTNECTSTALQQKPHDMTIPACHYLVGH